MGRVAKNVDPLATFSFADTRTETSDYFHSTVRLAQHLGVLSTVALAGGYRQVAGGRWYWSHESGATQAEINIHLSMMSALSIYTVLMRTNSPKQPGCLQLIIFIHICVHDKMSLGKKITVFERGHISLHASAPSWCRFFFLSSMHMVTSDSWLHPFRIASFFFP